MKFVASVHLGYNDDIYNNDTIKNKMIAVDFVNKWRDKSGFIDIEFDTEAGTAVLLPARPEPSY
jgi:hypothetical protein